MHTPKLHIGSLRRLPLRVWVFVFLPMALCLAQLFGVGPSVQLAFVGIVSSDAPSLYAMAYKDSLAQFPSLSGWIGDGFNWPYLVMGIVVVVCASFARSFKTFLVVIGVSSVFVISGFDIWHYANGELPDGLPISIGVNIIGGIITSVIIGSICLLSIDVRTYLESVSGKSSYLYGINFLLCGLFASAVAYYTLYFFYQPVAVDLEASAVLPLRGSMGGEPIKDGEASASDVGAKYRQVSLLPANLEGGSLRIMSPGRSPQLDWTTASPMNTFNVKVDFYADCAAEVNLSKLPKPAYTFAQNGVRDMSLAFGEKGSSVVLWGDARNKLTYYDKTPFFYWASKEKEGYSLSMFTMARGVVSNESAHEMATFASSTLLDPHKDGSSRLIPRTLTLTIDGKHFPVRFKSDVGLSRDRRLNCQNMPLELTEGRQTEAPIRAVMAAVLVRVTPVPKSDPIVAYRSGALLKISHVEGWIAVNGIAQSKLADFDLGQSAMISFPSGLESLAVYGKKVETNKDQSLFSVGDLALSFTKDMRLRLTGTAKALWVNQKRLNPTKWERLPFELQMLCISTILGGLYWIRNIVASMFLRLRASAKMPLAW